MNALLNGAVFEEFRRHILPSSEETLHFSQENKSQLTFPSDVINPDNVVRTQKFFKRADSLHETKLLRVFDKLDQVNRVDPKDPKTAEVANAVVTFVERIIKKIGEIDPRFTSTLVRGGSFFDDVKVGKPDEFDFTAKIERLCSACDALESRFSKRKKGFVYLVVKDVGFIQDFTEFVTVAEEDGVLNQGEQILSLRKIENHFSELVDKALHSIDVPKALSPAGVEKGLYWHSVHNGPCATINATYRSTSWEELGLDIDIAPTFDLPKPLYTPPILELRTWNNMSDSKNELMSKLTEMLHSKLKIMVVPFAFDKILEMQNTDAKTWSYRYSETWRVSFNSLEQFVFSQYDFESVEKQIYRLLKILKETFIQKTEDLESRAGTYDIKLDEPPSTTLTSVTAVPLGVVPAFTVEPLAGWRQELGDDSSDDSDDEASSNSSSGRGIKYEVLYDRSSLSSNSDVDDHKPSTETGERPSGTVASSESVYTELDLKHKSVTQNPTSDGDNLNSTQNCRSSKPLIKTYYLKMIFFFMRFMLTENEIWTRENLPALVVFVLKALFFVYSSNQKAFNNFWFQDIIDLPARPSVSLEILQSLEDIVDELERRMHDV